MIIIINYGLGNINAIMKVYQNLGIPVKIASNRNELEQGKKFILPGVGAFDYAMKKFNDSGMNDVLCHLVLKEKRPILGICVGMQMMAKKSEEGKLDGIGWLDADIKKFNSENNNTLLIPHMGWNSISITKPIPIIKNLDQINNFYFLHSYYFNTENEDLAIAYTEYGNDFISIVNKDNIYGVQFHPEKSHDSGIQLLKNFSEL